MKIQNSHQAYVSGLTSPDPVTSGPTATRGAPHAGERNDQVQLSGLGSVMSAVSSELAHHAAKIANLTTEVSAGRYRIEAQVLSDRMIEEHLRAAA